MIETDPNKRLTVNNIYFKFHIFYCVCASCLLFYKFYFFLIINFFLRCYAYFQLEDVSRHPWVTQYVNGESAPLISSNYRRNNRVSMSSVRSNCVANRKISMFVYYSVC